jgi:hypothetical protein
MALSRARSGHEPAGRAAATRPELTTDESIAEKTFGIVAGDAGIAAGHAGIAAGHAGIAAGQAKPQPEGPAIFAERPHAHPGGPAPAARPACFPCLLPPLPGNIGLHGQNPAKRTADAAAGPQAAPGGSPT